MMSSLRTILITLVTFSILAQAQSPPKRKKLKDFGSSLTRLKWNADKNAAEMSSDKRNTNSDEEDVIRIDTSLVSSDLLVLDRQRQRVSGLTAEDFIIAEDGAPQTVGHFSMGDVNVSRTIVLLIDYSGSQLPYLYNSIKAAKLLVDKLGPKDLMAIVTDDIVLIQDFTTDKKKLKEKLDSVLDAVDPSPRVIESGGRTPGLGLRHSHFGQSKQYSALLATLNEVFQEEDVRRIIIFQTDGDEAFYLRNPALALTIPPGLPGETLKVAQEHLKFHQQSFSKKETQFSLDDLYRAIERERATIYTVIPGVRLWDLPLEERLRKWNPGQLTQTAGWMGHLSRKDREKLIKRMEKNNQNVDPIIVEANVDLMSKQQAILAGVATISGGWADFLEVPEQADAIYSRIFSDINQRYIVGYYPTNKERDGKRRKIEIKIKGHPEYQVYGRRSYFAPGP
jgi:VWFA-related protein